MIRRTRALFAILLAFALLPIVSVTVTGPAEACIGAATAWMQSTARSHSTVQGARDVGEAAARHPDTAPFTAAEAFHLGLSEPLAATVPTAPAVTEAGASLSLHPARAPPALL